MKYGAVGPLFLACSFQALAASTTTSTGVAKIALEPVADACFSERSSSLACGGRHFLTLGGAGDKALFRFRLDSVPAGTSVVSARLVLHFNRITSEHALNPKRFWVFDLGRNFVEPGSGASNRIAVLRKHRDFALSGAQITPIHATGAGRYETDVTEHLKRVRAGDRDSSAAFIVFATELNAGASVFSREHPDKARRPSLEIEYSRSAPIARVEEYVLSQSKHVRLDGSRSSLPDGTAAHLAFAWRIENPTPASSLKKDVEVGRTPILEFKPDVPGFYRLRLRVTNQVTGETSDALANVIAGLNPHPRLHADRALIEEIKSLRDANDPLWTRFHNYVRQMPTTTAFPASVLNSYMLAHAVTGERRYFEGAWGIVRQGIYKNGTDRSGGIKTLLEHFNDAHTAAFLGGQYIALVAQLYDWCGNLFAAQQRIDLIDWMNQACEYNHLHNSYSLARFRNDGAAVTYGLGAAAYVTLGENPQALKLFSWFRETWEETLQSLDIMGKGGASGEGNGYGASPTGFSFIRIANMAHYASGEDLYASHPWFRQRLLYDAFSAYPGSIGGPDSPVPGGWPGLPVVHPSSIGGDGKRGISHESRNLRLRQNGMVLSRWFRGSEEADIWNWVFRQPAVDHAVSDVESYSDLLYYSPKPKLVKPSKLSFFDPSMGFVYIRSDWDSPDATWIAFWAGPHLDTHQHLDQGAFTIFKRRDLAPKTGHYDWNIRGPHQLSWYFRTISSNGLLIGDPRESFQGFIGAMGCDPEGKGTLIPAPDNSTRVCVPNEGGQRTMRPLNISLDRAETFETYRDLFDVARVVHFRDDGQAVSVVADITNAYNNPRHSTPGNSPKVTKVYRRLVYLRKADVLLVADTVESTNPEFEKKWLIHSLDRIEVGGEREVVSPGETVHSKVDAAKIVVDDDQPSDKRQTTFDLRKGFSSLLLRTVFPREFRYRKIGGREPADNPHPDMYDPDSEHRNDTHFHRHLKDFWVKDFSEGVVPNHRSFNVPPEEPIEVTTKAYTSVFGAGYGRWRLEVEPVGRNKADYFLNVLKPTTNRSDALRSVKPLESDRGFGVEIAEGGSVFSVVFSKQDLAAPDIKVR